MNAKTTFLILLAFLAAPRTMSAQSGIIASLEGNPTGKDLSYEDIIGKSVRPSLPDTSFCDEPHFDIEALEEDGSVFLTYPDGSRKCVAKPESEGISYGCSVSRNEFGIRKGLFWSPDRSRLAFYRKDERRVGMFPILDIDGRTGSLENIRYPMNGMSSEIISLGIYDIASGKTVYAQVPESENEAYLCSVSWSPDSRYIFIQVLDRTQHHMDLNMYRSCDGSFVRTLLSEDDDRWVEPCDELHFLEGSYHFIYTTDCRDGFRNLYLCDTLGGVRRLTECDGDVSYLANNGKSVFYTSAEISPVENHLMRIDVRDSKRLKSCVFSSPRQLTSEEGWHEISMNRDCSLFFDTFSSWTNPGTVLLKDSNGKTLKTIAQAENPLAGYRSGKALFGTVPSADGKFLNNYRLFLPADFNPEQKYPVIVYVYGGPHSQMVQNKWLGNIRMWEMLLSEKGYIVYIQDNRGTSNRGSAYEKAINRHCGKAEMEDQMVGVDMLCSLPFTDCSRIGVSGWSYGGFMTLSLICSYPDRFKTAACGGPVIDWKWYEVMYGERYMDTPQTNPEGFSDSSLMGKAAALKGHRALILQGWLDDTVLCMHSMNFIMQCIREGVQVDYFPYPLSEHNVTGPWRAHMYEKLTRFFEENL